MTSEDCGDRVGGSGGYEGLLSHRVEAKERHAEVHPEEFVAVGNTSTGSSRGRGGGGGKEGGSCVWKGESPCYPSYGVIGRKAPGWMDLFPLHRPPQWKSPEEERMLRCRRRKEAEEPSCAPILCRRKDHSLPPPPPNKKTVSFSPEGVGGEETRAEHPLYRTTNGEYGRLASHAALLGGGGRVVRGASDLHPPKVTRRNTKLNL